jgi:hypothetical protein
MTHPASSIETVLALARQQLPASAIAARTGIPRTTVRDWLSGRAPVATPPLKVDPDALPPEYVYLLALYLGDGCLSRHPRSVYKLRVTLDAAYPGIVESAMGAIRAVMPANHANCCDRQTWVEVYCYSQTWPQLFPQHGPGKKHERSIALQEWQEQAVRASPEQLLRGLIHSDGCRSINTGTNWRHPRYSFSNRSDDIRRIFCWACDLLGLRWTTAPHTVYVSRKADVARLDTFIGPKA